MAAALGWPTKGGHPMTYRGKANGILIELDKPLPFEIGQVVRVAVEPEGAPRIGSPAAILWAMRQPPHVSEEDDREFERAIEEGKLPTRDRGILDDDAE